MLNFYQFYIVDPLLGN